MSIANFVPEYWATELLVAFRDRTVFGQLANRNYQGTISGAGDTVKITTPSAITVGAYSGTVSYETPASTQQSLVIDQDLYWAFELDDVDQAQANVSLMSAYMTEAADALAQKVDTDLAGLYTAAGLASISVDVGADDFYDKMVLAGQQLDEESVPRAGRWVVMTPAGYADLLKNTNFITASEMNSAMLRSGALGMVSGFEVLVSNNLTNTTASTYAYLYGTNAAITMAEQVANTEAIRRDTAFSDGVRGRMVYGRKVVRANSLGVLLADQT